MPAAVDLIRKRRHRRDKTARGARSKARRAVLSLFSVLGLGLGLAAIGLAVFYGDFTRDLPSLETLPEILDPETGFLASPTVITDRSGDVILARLGTPVDGAGYLLIRSEGFPQVSQSTLDAFIAAADPGYSDHPGFYRMTLLQGRRDTIPLKLVSDLLFWREPEGPRRFIREGLLAAQVVSTYGRDQVLEWYLNSTGFGYETYGLEAAARLYFGKSASRLSLSESAVLAAVAQAPDLNPFATPDLAIARRDQVIQDMVALGLISLEEALAARTSPLSVRAAPEDPQSGTSAFVRLVRNQVERTIPAGVLARSSLTIVSTLDVNLQAELFCTVEAQLERLSGSEAFLPETCRAARLLPSLAGQNQSDPGLAAEGVVLDPRTGQVLAFAAVGALEGPLAAGGLHAPGSILTPYIYLSALTRGLTPGSLVWDIPAYLTSDLNRSPNADGSFHGPMRIRTALAGDYLVPALQMLGQLNPANVWTTAAISGLPSLAQESGTLILEGGALSLIEITHAYSALSTQGVIIGYEDPVSRLDPVPLTPTAVLRVVDGGGRAWLDEGPPQARPVMSAPLAFALTDMLSDETARWPALGHPNVLEVGRPAGVKMGFNQDGSSVWTVGFTPQLSLGVWVGSSEPVTSAEPDPGGAAGYDPRAAAGIWHAMLKFASADLPPNGWSAPQGIVEMNVCDPSGLLPTADCPLIVREIFLTGTEPVQPDTLYRRFEVNRETGLLATVFTPAGLIEERVFFVPPPEALSWAQAAGMDIPPENYDLVSRPPAPDPEASVRFPDMFAYVSGEVRIRGSADGAGFQSFSVQIGRGLNPQQWLQIGDVSSTPVSDGELAVWDTGSLNGLYAIRLLVVRENNLVDTHIVQVTVDNQPPELGILYPANGQEFSYPDDETITMQLTASDNLLLQRIDIFLDGRLLQTLAQPPYALSVQLLPGERVLKAEAVDQAGNMAEVELTVTVNR